MKPHPKIRKMVKWGGAVVTVLLVVVWIGSGWWQICWERAPDRYVVIAGGLLRLCDDNSSHGVRLGLFREIARADSPLRWWFYADPDRTFPQFGIPLWLPAVISLAVVITARRLETLARRRARLEFCARCNYDRAGLAAGAVCPECGAGDLRVGERG